MNKKYYTLMLLSSLTAVHQNSFSQNIFFEDFGNSGTRVTSPYVPQSGRDAGITPFPVTNTPFYQFADPNSTNANPTYVNYARNLSDGFYAVVQPNLHGGASFWNNGRPRPGGWVDHTTATSPVKDGAVMILNAGGLPNQFYRRLFAAEPGASYRVSAWRLTVNATASWQFEAQDPVTEVSLGNSGPMANTRVSLWEQSIWEFQVPVSCNSNAPVAISLRNESVQFGGNDIFIDDISVDKIASPASNPINCPVNATSLITAVPDSDRTAINTPKNIQITANDTLTENGVIDYSSIHLFNTKNGATVAHLGNGLVRYTPGPSFIGTDDFDYTVCNTVTPTASCSTTKVTVTVSAFDVFPVPDHASTTVGQTIAIAVLANDTADRGPVRLSGTFTQPTHGQVTLGSNGSLNYTANASHVGLDNFTYEVCDQTIAPATPVCRTGTVEVTVSAPYSATDDTGTTPANTPVTLNLLGNDLAQAGPAQVRAIAAQPSHGSVTLNADGTVLYTPNAGFVGEDRFSYTLCDSATPQPQCTQAQVVVTVTPPLVTPPITPPVVSGSVQPVPSLQAGGLLALGVGLAAMAGLRRRRSTDKP